MAGERNGRACVTVKRAMAEPRLGSRTRPTIIIIHGGTQCLCSLCTVGGADARIFTLRSLGCSTIKASETRTLSMAIASTETTTSHKWPPPLTHVLLLTYEYIAGRQRHTDNIIVCACVACGCSFNYPLNSSILPLWNNTIFVRDGNKDGKPWARV